MSKLRDTSDVIFVYRADLDLFYIMKYLNDVHLFIFFPKFFWIIFCKSAQVCAFETYFNQFGVKFHPWRRSNVVVLGSACMVLVDICLYAIYVDHGKTRVSQHYSRIYWGHKINFRSPKTWYKTSELVVLQQRWKIHLASVIIQSNIVRWLWLLVKVGTTRIWQNQFLFQKQLCG